MGFWCYISGSHSGVADDEIGCDVRPGALIKRYRHFEGSLWFLLQGVENRIEIKIHWLFVTPDGFTLQNSGIEAMWWTNEWITQWSKVLSDTLTVPELINKFLYFMEPEISLPPSYSLSDFLYHKHKIRYGYICSPSKRASVSFQCDQHTV